MVNFKITHFCGHSSVAMNITFMHRCFNFASVALLVFIIYISFYFVNYRPTFLYKNSISITINNTTSKVEFLQKNVVKKYTTTGVKKVNKHFTASKPMNYSKATTTHRRQRSYFVYSAMCRMPFVRVHTPELYAMYESNLQQVCINTTPLVTVIYDTELQHYVIHINATVAGKAKVRCSYREVLEPQTNSEILRPRLQSKVDFQHNYLVPAQVSAMVIECVDVHVKYMQSGRRLTKEIHALIQQHRIKDETTTNSVLEQRQAKPSVILLGIDSMSRVNVQRILPELSVYLNQSGWHEMQGYNKISDGTLTNLYTVLTGLAPASFEQSNHTHKPFIWQDYGLAGYKTAFSMDTNEDYTLSTLNAALLQQPVDHYLPSYLIASRKALLQRHAECRKYKNIDFIMTHCLHFVQRYLQRQPIFGFYWLNDFAVNRFKGVMREQNLLLHYLGRLKEVGLFEHAVVVLFSDHGIRHGRMRELSDAFLEERMPLLHIWLPAWFRSQFPDAADALAQNRQRLTSNYDLYLTLRDILTLNIDKTSAESKLSDCPKCQSLFRAVPFNRSCRDAGIKKHWCTCHVYKKVPISTVRTLMEGIVRQINNYLVEQKLEQNCSKFKLHYINEAQLKVKPHDRKNITTYRIKFMLQPGLAKFELTVQFNNHTNNISTDIASISRLDTHIEHSRCIKNNDSEIRKFCVCAFNRN